ncbi:MAG TPA: M56 family metallopeptidase [Steroidobacteraceae bacterium]|jgi:beta-lactamase regulating signal transducer with metallopeptidase domain
MLDLLTIAGIALKTSLLMIATAALSFALRRQPAAFRHLLWTSALALSLLMPLAVLYVPEVAPTLPLPRLRGREWEEAASAPILLWLWIAGSLCCLARELLSNIGLARWLRRARPLESARWMATLASLDCKVRALESPHIASPCTWGLLTPVLLLPSAGDAWSEAARRSALLHELAHVGRRDMISALISRLACVLHWYNPLVWLAAAHARSLQERACDDAVLRAGAIPSDYAQFLLDVAARMSGMNRPRRTSIGMAHSSLRARIVAILDPQARRAQPERSQILAACAALFAITILLGMTSVATVPPLPKLPAPPAVPAKLPTLPKLPVPPVPVVPPTLPTPPASPTS